MEGGYNSHDNVLATVAASGGRGNAIFSTEQEMYVFVRAGKAA
jgi:hypothetical protein